MVRLQKYLSGAGVCSRRKGEEFIKAGRIKVNGEVITQPGVQVDPKKTGWKWMEKLSKTIIK